MALFFDYHGLKSLRTLKKGLSTSLKSPGYAFRQASLLVKRNANWLISGYSSRSFALSRIFFVLTWACDSRCAMCALWSKTGFCHEMDKDALMGNLSLQDYKRVLKQAKPYAPQIVLFGGEPLLSPKWKEVAKLAKELGFRVSLSTDGSRLLQEAEAIVNWVDHFQVSLDAATPQLHDRIRHYRGLYDKLVEGIRRVQEIKKEKRKVHPLIDVGVMVLPENLSQLDQIVDTVESWGVDIDTLNIQHLEYITPQAWEKQKAHLMRFPHVNYWQGVVRKAPVLDTRLLLEKMALLKAKKRRNISHLAFNPEMNEVEVIRHYSGKPFHPGRRCSLPWLEAHILPSGDVWVCPDYYAGNVKENSLQAIWNGERAKAIRAFLNAGKRFPACNNCMGNYLYA